VKAILILVIGATFLFSLHDPGLPFYQTAGQTPQRTPAQEEARQELNKAARSYAEGNFAEAQLDAEKALAVDPSNKTAPYFIARAIQEAYKSIVYLFSAVKDDEPLREWVFRRAIDPTFSDEKRAEAFVVLASRDWDCSFKITELPSQHSTTIVRGRQEVHYRKPKDPAEFLTAQRCAAEGLEIIDSAINLAPDSETAWQYKTYLLLELAKLSEMANDLPLRTEYTNQATAARRTTDEIAKRKAAAPGTVP